MSNVDMLSFHQLSIYKESFNKEYFIHKTYCNDYVLAILGLSIHNQYLYLKLVMSTVQCGSGNPCLFFNTIKKYFNPNHGTIFGFNFTTIKDIK